ncbi:hypothetical protein B0I32_118152 [Nonomuraea fuscirosea]|uniref:Uncharacterized protein n=1 Tax=Nonomuraea fuscirosea TaxID=1291556 RepID=A0A2T0MPM4_9ACTN|nr:hypothetical protein B0I32_118152 [Nonomuraea fuscirosea]
MQGKGSTSAPSVMAAGDRHRSVPVLELRMAEFRCVQY